MRIDVWSDIVCPWCAIGKKRLETALKQFEHAAECEVVWHSFELDSTPEAQRPPVTSIIELLAKKYRMTLAQAQAANDRVSAAAQAEGLAWEMAKIRPSGTLDAHRLLHLAAHYGLQTKLMDALMNGYFAGGRHLADPATLTELAVTAGLDPAEVAELLTGNAFLAEVRADQRQATQLGITGVPFFVLGSRYGLSGAQPVAAFLQALSEAWADPEAHSPS